VKISCVKWWHGAEKQTQSEKQIPTQEAKLEITSYYHFQERKQRKKKKQTKYQGSLNLSQNQSIPQPPKKRNPKQGIMSINAGGKRAVLQAGQVGVDYPGVL